MYRTPVEPPPRNKMQESSPIIACRSIDAAIPEKPGQLEDLRLRCSSISRSLSISSKRYSSDLISFAPGKQDYTNADFGTKIVSIN